MTCREFTEFLDEYIEGKLDAARRAAFDKHFAQCANCANYLSSYRRTISLGKQALENPDEQVPPAVPAGLVKAILAARSQQ